MAETLTIAAAQYPIGQPATLDAWRDAFLREHGFVDAFLDLKDRYAPDKSFPDQMTRVIHVQMGSVNKTVTVLDGVEPVPPAFTSVWTALKDAIRTTTRS